MVANFLWGAGSSNNGQLISPLTLMSTDLNSLASAATVTSSVAGTSGLINNSNTGQGMIGELFLTLGAIGSALTAGANAAGWWLVSTDNGTTFEHTVASTALSRAPDFFIPLPATTISAGWVYKAMGPVMIPALAFKIYLMNNTGQAWASSGNTLKILPYSMQY